MSLLGIMADATAAASDKGGLPQLDAGTYPGQLFWLAVLFGIFYLMMDRVFLPALSGIIEERKNRIADDLDEAGDFNQQAETAQAAYRAAIAEAKTNASMIASETRAALDAEIKEMQAETEARLESEQTAAQTRINTLHQAATSQITAAARETAQTLIETLTGERADEADISAAIEQVALEEVAIERASNKEAGMERGER